MKSYQHINLIFVREMFFLFSYMNEHCINNICSCKLFKQKTNYNITQKQLQFKVYYDSCKFICSNDICSNVYSVELYIMVKIENFRKQLRQTPTKKSPKIYYII